MIQLENVTKIYRTERIETLALDDINLTIEAGEILSIMGPSGSGKSTLLNLIGLLDQPSQGKILLDGKEVGDKGEKAVAHLRNRWLGFIFQSFHLVSDLRVVDNVELPLLYRRLSNRERRQRALEALEKVGLGSRTHHFPTQLSGGQRQRVAIARAIVGEPKILLADEPTGNLDSEMGDEIMEILRGLNREGTTVVVVTHDQRLAEQGQRIVRMFDGRQVH